MKQFVLFGFVAISLAVALAVPRDETLTLSLANDEFGMRLLQSLENEQRLSGHLKNLFISPFSISSVLAMLLAGSANRTYNEIYNTLGLESSHYSSHQIFVGYQKLLHDLSNPTKGKDNVLNVANSMAVQKNYDLLASFLNNVTTYFGSHVFAEDFASNGHKATADINEWVKEKTHGKIVKLFDKDLDALTRLVLLNAIYFKGTWHTKFDKEKTTTAPFHMSRDLIEPVPTMHLKSKLRYASFDDGQMVEIPYQNQTLSMFVFLPNQNENRALSSVFNTQKIFQRMTALENTQVNLHLPKFKIEDKYSLAGTLVKMGMKDSFGAFADFSNINGRKDLQLSDVVHKTFIEVNEEGSEAAAVTGAVVVVKSMPLPSHQPIEFRADRPFMFLIRDNQHHLTLFSGIIHRP